jgi:hypothetical protein
MRPSKLYSEVVNESFSLQPDPSCDCCKYFDFTFSQAGGQFTGLEKPLYQEISKGEKHELQYIKPKQYIYNIARGFGGLSYEDVVDSGAVSKEAVIKYAKAMKNGEKFPIGWYKVDSGSQEGRHRALAAIELGCNSIPVVVITTLDYEDRLDIAEKYKGLSKEELNQIYINKGYNGITGLGWNDLQRFINHNI